jgi:hypothetical protein
MNTSPTAALDFREVTGEHALLDEIYRLRVLVWRNFAPSFTDQPLWMDAWDENSRHWAFLYENSPIAAARLSIHSSLQELPHAECYDGVLPADLPGPIASFNRLVIHRNWRGLGLAEQLDIVRLESAEAMKCRCAVGITDSGNHRIKQLEQMAFQVAGLARSNVDGPRTKNPLVVIFRRLAEAQLTDSDLLR